MCGAAFTTGVAQQSGQQQDQQQQQQHSCTEAGLANAQQQLAKLVEWFPPEIRAEMGLPSPGGKGKGKGKAHEASQALASTSSAARKLGEQKVKQKATIERLREQLKEAEDKLRQVDVDIIKAEEAEDKCKRTWAEVVGGKGTSGGGPRRRGRGTEEAAAEEAGDVKDEGGRRGRHRRARGCTAAGPTLVPILLHLDEVG